MGRSNITKSTLIDVEQLLSLAEVAELAGCSVQHIRNQVSRRAIGVTLNGGRVMIARSEYARFVAANTIPAHGVSPAASASRSSAGTSSMGVASRAGIAPARSIGAGSLSKRGR